MAAVEARAARPWWRQAFAAWPLAARAAFVVVSCAIVAGVVMLGIFGSAGLQGLLPAAQETLAPLAMIRSALLGFTDFCLAVYHAIPPLYVYGGLALFISLYGALFGLGAAAYRAFQAQR